MPVQHDVKFGEGGGRDLLASVYTPEGVPEKQTLVVLLHGGGWRVGSRDAMAVYAKGLVEHGYAAMAPEYRLLGEAPWPAQSDDVKTAIDWAQANAARLGCARVVAQGYSAGGHLAIIATADLIEQGAATPAAVVAFFPPDEIVFQPQDKTWRDAAGLLGDKASAEGARRASPVHRIAPGFPPTFLLQGGVDWMVRPGASINLYQALVKAGAPAELHIYAEHHHEFARQPSMLEAVLDEIDLFLCRMVVDPAKYQAEAAEQNMFAAGPDAFAKRMAAR